MNFTLTVANYFSDYLGSVERDTIIKNLNNTVFGEFPNAIMNVGGIYASLLPHDLEKRYPYLKIHQW